MDEIRNVMIYSTSDPSRFLVEYELADTLFVTMIEIRDGLTRLWREFLAV